MFLIRAQKEFPELVDDFRLFCEDRGRSYLDKNFSYFHDFFAKNQIHISCEENGDTYQGIMRIFKVEAPDPFGVSFEDPDEACEDAIYRAFTYLNDLEE